MKKLLASLLATAALAALSPASAADIEAPAGYDWTGVYLGIQLCLGIVEDRRHLRL